MPETIAEAFVSIRPDTRGFTNDLTTQLSPATGEKAGAQLGAGIKKGITPGIAGIAGAIGGLFVAQKIKSFFSGAIAEAQEAAKVGAQTAAVIKSQGNAANISAPQVGKLAEQLSLMSGVDDEVIQSGANMLLTFRNIRNEAGKGNDIFNQASKATLNMAAAFSKASGGELDLQSASIQLGKALNDPIEGVTALQRVGVRLTEQQKAQVKAFVESGNILGAQKVILAELNAEFGGSAAAQATSADKARVAWGNLKEAIGTALLPVLNKLLAIGTPIVQWLTENRTAASALAAVIGGVVLVALAAYTIAMISAAAATLAAAAPVIAITAAVAAMAVGVIYLWTHWDQIWGWIADHPGYGIVLFLLGSLLTGGLLPLTVGIIALAKHWDEFWGTAGPIVQTAWDIISAPARFLLDALTAIWRMAVKVKNALSDIADKAGGGLLDAVTGGFLPGGGPLDWLGFGASGGIVTRPTLSVIGERGPEAVVPLNRMPGASALPWSDRGGDTINNNFYAPLPDAVTIAMEAMRARRVAQYAMGA